MMNKAWPESVPMVAMPQAELERTRSFLLTGRRQWGPLFCLAVVLWLVSVLLVTDEEGTDSASDEHGADSVVIGTAEALAASGAVDYFAAAPPFIQAGVGAFGVGFAIGTAGRWLVGELSGGSDPVPQTTWINE